MPEVLSPVGDFERLRAAVQYGADAVYLGGKTFGMRATPANFDYDELKKAVEFAHKNNIKVYLTCNTLPTNEEVNALPEYLRYAESIGIDAVIVADIGVLMCVKRYAPKLEVHISTQAGIVNYLTASEMYNLGAKRVVLARELSLDDIACIRQKTPAELEIETFVHGAMCMSFSGRCLISQYITGRDANRGECAQPCRWGYHLVEEKRPNEYYPIFEDSKGSYILNARDLCMIEHIDELTKAGVSSLKIEGRAKSAYYVAVVTNAYRCAVDMLPNVPEWVIQETTKVSHREYSTGFYFGKPGQYYESGGYVRTWDVIATVDYSENGLIYCTQKNRFFKGDKAEILMPKQKPIQISIEKLYSLEGEELEVAQHPMMKIKIPFLHEIPSGAMIRKISDR